VSSDPEPKPPHDASPPLNYADPQTPRPPLGSDEPESWADVGRAMGIVALVLVSLFLLIAIVCGGLL
jgi:hypothetical protein